MSSKNCESCKKNNQNRKIIGFTDFNCEMILYHPSKYWFYENFYPDCFDTFSLPMKLNALLSEVFFRKYWVPLCFFNPNRLYTIYFRFLKTKISYHRLKPSLFSQWSLVRSFIWDYFCISFVWLCSQREVSQTKRMQTKSRTKLKTRLHWVERLCFIFGDTHFFFKPIHSDGFLS